MPFATPPVDPRFRVVLIDRTTDRPEVEPFLQKLVPALQEHADRIQSFHGVGAVVRLAADPSDRQEGEVACHIRHKQGTDPQGALGWHQVTGGVPDIEIPLDYCSGLTGDSDALDVVASHELGEMMLDPGANQTVDNGNGRLSAQEASDRVEDCFYDSQNGLHLSNFLLRAAWIPGAPGPYDFMCALPSQLDAHGDVEMTQGGYDIEGRAPRMTDVTPAEAKADGEPAILNESPGILVPVFSKRSKAPLSKLREARHAQRYSRTARRLGTKLHPAMCMKADPDETQPSPTSSPQTPETTVDGGTFERFPPAPPGSLVTEERVGPPPGSTAAVSDRKRKTKAS